MLYHLVSKIYGFFVKRRNRLFDTGKYSITHLNTLVISVGNLSVGGTGKTPFTKMLAILLKEMGYKPSIISSGYGRKSKGLVVVSDGNSILSNADECGDEMMMLAKSINVPILVHDKKYLAGIDASEKFDSNCILLDDGFQHRRLHRDLDIVLVDKAVFEKPELMPLGRLREPLESLKRAEIIILMNCDVPIKFIELFPEEKTFHADTKTLELSILSGLSFPRMRESETNDLTDKVVVLTAIANTQRFVESIKKMGPNIEKEFFFRDHHYFTDRDIEKVIGYCSDNGIENVVTTEKDAVKLEQFLSKFTEKSINLSVLPIEIEIKEKPEFLEKIQTVLKVK